MLYKTDPQLQRSIKVVIIHKTKIKLKDVLEKSVRDLGDSKIQTILTNVLLVKNIIASVTEIDVRKFKLLYITHIGGIQDHGTIETWIRFC